MATGPHISLSAETLFEVGGFSVTNSILTSLIVSSLLILLALYAKSVIKPTHRPTGFQNVIEWVIEALYNLVHSVTNNEKKTRLFFPLISTFFLVILLNNWIGLIPGVGTITLKVDEEVASYNLDASQLSPIQKVKAVEVEHTEAGHSKSVPIFRPGSADLNTTLALAIISVASTQIFGVKYLSLGYFKKFINFSNPIMFVVGILEIISEFAKVLSFAFRLFGNIFAGEVLLVVIAYIGGNFLFFAPMPFYGLELFVGFIQALVFAMLSLVFFNMATHSHDDH